MLNREEIEWFFNEINAGLYEKGTCLNSEIPGLIQTFKKLKQKILDEHALKTLAAGEFTIEMAILTFGLQFSDYGAEYLWKIEDIPDTRESPTLSLDALLEKYAKTVDHSKKSACRMPIDLVLMECVTKLQAKLKYSSNDKMKALAPHKNVRICCDVSFSYHLSPKPVGEAAAAIDHANTVNGRVDYGVGIVTPGLNRRFHSLLIVEAEKKGNLSAAFPRLVVYLACLRQARLASGCTDCTVYGVTSDGYDFCFVTITHEGLVKVSRSFSISRGDMKIVIGCIIYILRQALERSPTLAPYKIKDDSNAGGTHDHDEAMSLDHQDGHDCSPDE